MDVGEDELNEILQSLRNEGWINGTRSVCEVLREFGDRRAVADLRHQVRQVLGEEFSDKDVTRVTMDRGTRVLFVLVEGIYFRSAYYVSSTGQITFTTPHDSESKEPLRWLN